MTTAANRRKKVKRRVKRMMNKSESKPAAFNTVPPADIRNVAEDKRELIKCTNSGCESTYFVPVVQVFKYVNSVANNRVEYHRLTRLVCETCGETLPDQP